MEARVRMLTNGVWLLAVLLSLALPAPRWAQAAAGGGGGGAAPPPAAAGYCDSCNADAQPPFLGFNTDPPMVMLAASKDHQLFFKAYNDYTDLDGDGLADTTYKDSITYYGYFDSSKCYDYNSTGDPHGAGRFEPKALTDYASDPARDPAHPAHYCTVTATGVATNTYWSGNFLNWVSMSRIDVIRKVLFGGHRRVDTAASTVLERAYLPHDAHSWARYYNGADLDKLTPFTNGVDYTLVDADLRNNGITFANTTDASTGYSQALTDTSPPLIKVVKGNYSLWASNERWQCTWESGAPADNHAGVSNSNDPANSGINAYSDNPTWAACLGQGNYVARVQACVAGLIGDERCKLYPGPDGIAGTVDDNYKPIGLLQVYGDTDQMFFGMIAGTYDKHVSGGDVIRNMGSMKDEINVATDGTFKLTALSAGGLLGDNNPLVGGLINAWSLYRIVGYSHDNGTYRDTNPGDNCDWGLSAFDDVSKSNACTNWGNPFSEIYYQAVNYFAGGGVNGTYRSNSSTGISGLPVPQAYKNVMSLKNYCSRLNIVNFNSSIASYDADELDGNSYKPSTIWDSNALPGDKSSAAMTQVVGAGEGINGHNFFVGQVGLVGDQLCTSKTVGSLGDVLGLCPDSPRLQGSFRIAGLAYYAHTQDIRPASATGGRALTSSQRINTYSVAMASVVPAIEIPNPLTGVTAVTLLPACRNSSLTPQGNCTVVDFKVVSQTNNSTTGIGTGKFYINWDDSEQGGDYDQDEWGILEYIIDANANTIAVKTQVIAQSTPYILGFGYVIGGTTNDGFHVHSGINGYEYTDAANVGQACNDNDGCNCRPDASFGVCTVDGATTKNYTLGTASASQLKDPLWYASKWGGFDDRVNSTPNQPSLWDKEHNADGTAGPDGIPDTYFYATNPGQVEPALNRAFLKILKSMASGSAASVISSSRSGEGALYQAVFWPAKGDTDASLVKWLGEVHSLFVDSQGNTYEDTDQNRQLDPYDPVNNPNGDKPVVLFYDTSDELTKACYGTVDVTTNQCSATVKLIENVKFLWSAAESLYKITDGTGGTVDNITSNRSDITNAADVNYISATKKRNIFTWNDLNNDGIVQADEILPFVANWDGKTVTTSNAAAAVRGSRATPPAASPTDDIIYKDFGVTDTTNRDKLINWIRGLDQDGMRSRNVNLDTNGDGVADNVYVTWRLGDIINSTPMLVGRPAENYKLLYKDKTYGDFLERYGDRRNVIYFGGNDGMLHAVNGGFYREKLRKFCLSNQTDAVSGDCTNEASQPELGAELWAYVPYNLSPHLNCLADANYCHKYYVDQRPRIFDVRIFTPDNDHPQGWGTVLVGGMRFGGTPVNAVADLGLAATDARIFSSSYFFFDITNPEKPPVLLGEMTHLNNKNVDGVAEASMGYTTGIPTMAPMMDVNNDGTILNKDDTVWYMVFGNGPNGNGAGGDDAKGFKAKSTLKPTVFVMPMNWLAGITASPHELRFPYYTGLAENAPLGHDSGGFALPGVGATVYGFVSDPITVDYELLSNYRSDVVYMGTVEQHNPLDAVNPWFGKMYRLVTGDRVYTSGSEAQNFLTPTNWKTNILINAGQPITAAASVGWDGTNYWVYFGTGRFFNAAIDTPDLTRQSYFGIKEPMVPAVNGSGVCDRHFSFSNPAIGSSTVERAQPGLNPVVHNATPGQAGLLNVTGDWTDSLGIVHQGLEVHYDTTTQPPITTVICGADCPTDLANSLTTSTDQYQTLVDYIAGTPGSCAKTNYGTDGWYRNFDVQAVPPADDNAPPVYAERNLGQAALLGGLLTFTTYSPKDQECERMGNSTLYALYYQTGTAWKSPVFGGSYGLWALDEVAYKLDLGRGLALTPNLHVGEEEGSKAFVQTSTGAIVAIEQPNLPLTSAKTGRKSWFEGIPTTP